MSQSSPLTSYGEALTKAFKDDPSLDELSFKTGWLASIEAAKTQAAPVCEHKDMALAKRSWIDEAGREWRLLDFGYGTPSDLCLFLRLGVSQFCTTEYTVTAPVCDKPTCDKVVCEKQGGDSVDATATVSPDGHSDWQKVMEDLESCVDTFTGRGELYLAEECKQAIAICQRNLGKE